MTYTYSHLHSGVNNHGDLHELQTRYFVDEVCKIEGDSNVKVAMEIYKKNVLFERACSKTILNPRKPIVRGYRRHGCFQLQFFVLSTNTNYMKRAFESFVVMFLLIHVHVSAVSKITCRIPEEIPDAEPMSILKNTYNVGENVTYKCRTGLEEEVRTCLSDGTWSGAAFVCGSKLT